MHTCGTPTKDLHRHRCNSCHTIWSHSEASKKCEACHHCPTCGAEQFQELVCKKEVNHVNSR